MIVKICKHHGELIEKDVVVEKNKSSKSGESLRCRLCRRAKDVRWKLVNRDKHRESANRKRNEDRKLFREGLSEIEPRANILAREDRKINPDKHKKWAKDYREKMGPLRTTMEIVRVRKMTLQEYENMFIKQKNRCLICNELETRKNRNGEVSRLAVDHCHTSGKIRGLLCHDCNTGIGKFKDNIELLQSAIRYLEEHKHIE